ncbi:MAG TPA: acyl-CoA dehydrogenase [Pusillimonas sp.]|uniref:acyl-CoA dehydrogenase n=1 Tax=unclassified Pusillimonas TaxID=2640016 RepID=UPI002626115B|nr:MULTISPECIES: acyl-CoA dehydrogenase [unclassified Pusillimonas]HLU18386.1 acyl-CoA dehydrogenase [Pusillimonas sp.]
MGYRTPLREYQFVIEELSDLPGLLSLPAFDHVTPDLVRAVLDENARFVESVIAPLNTVGDTSPATLHGDSVQTSPGFPEAFQHYAQGGWQGLQHDVRIGGQGFPKLVGTAASENINAANLAFSLCPLLTDGVIEALSAVGSPEQQALYIPPLMEGRWTGTMNLTEPGAGSDLALLKTRAEPQPDGSFRLFGQKIFITYGEHDLAENIVHLVLARLPDAPAGVKGISLFIVPKFIPTQNGTLGPRNDVSCASLEHKLGIHGSPTAVMLYGSGRGEAGEGAVAYLVGELHHGLAYMFVMMNAARFAVGVQGVAVAERATQQAWAYAADRLQGQPVDNPGAGTVSINQHPDVQRMLWTMRALTDAGRALAALGARALDISRHHADDDERARQKALYEYLVPIIKGFCTENAVEVASLGVQVHGGMGYIEETGAAQYFRDARILPIYEGTTAIQANDLLGRKTWRDQAAVAQYLQRQMRGLLAEIQRRAEGGSAHRTGLAVLARHLENAIVAYEQAVDILIRHADAPRAAFWGSVPYLMLAGTVLGGWQMAQAALISIDALDSQKDPDPFYSNKLSAAIMYASLILPRAQSWLSVIRDGSDLVAYAGNMTASPR